MSEHPFALLIHEYPEPFESLKQTLMDLSVKAFSVPNYSDAESIIGSYRPQVVFVDDSLGDGSWWRILSRADAANEPLSVIVVGLLSNYGRYVAVTAKGAFDIVAPPFEPESMDFVIKSAIIDAHHRKEALARTKGLE